MRVVLRMSAIVAALLAVTGSVALSGCGQRGPLYLPAVPPLPAKPAETTEAPTHMAPDTASDAQPGDRTGLTLAPADDLGAQPKAVQPAPASAASSTAPHS